MDSEKRTHQKRIAAIMAPFREVTTKDIKGALHPHLTEETPTREFFPRKLTSTVDLEAAKKMSPEWIDIDAYLDEFSKLSDAAVWRNLFSKHASQQQLEQLAVALTGRFAKEALSVEQVPAKFQYNNQDLYGYNICLTAMAALYGIEIKKLIDEDAVNSAFPSAIAIAEYFNSPVNNIAELDDRLSSLFPAKDCESSPNSAYQFYVKNKAFIDAKECPAKNITKLLLNAFGEIYHEGYNRLLFQRISPK